MKINRILVFLLILILISSCDRQVDQPSPTVPADSFEIFRYEAFQVVVPNWQESPVQDSESVLSLFKDGQFILVNRYHNLPAIFATQFLSYIEESQSAFLVQEAFRLLAEHQEQIEFLAWFALHDNTLETSYESALTFIPHRPDLVQDEAFMTVFVDFLNYMGLLESDGTPKEAWGSFQVESREYLKNIP